MTSGDSPTGGGLVGADLVLDGTVTMQPGQGDLSIVGRRVRLVRRTDPRAGVPAAWCDDLADRDGNGLGVLIEDVAWDQPADVDAWLAEHPPPRRR